MQRKVSGREASAARRLLGVVQLRADDHASALLGERDVHHARRLHVPRQPGAAVEAMDGTDIHCHARARQRLCANSRCHQVREVLRATRHPRIAIRHFSYFL